MNSILSQILGLTNRPFVRTRTSRKPKQAPPVGADWLALANSPPDRTRSVYDSAGVPLVLNKSDVLAHGGEGVIYKFAKNPAFLIKICKDDTIRDSRKLAAFRSQCAVMEDLLAAVLDGEKWNDNRWFRFCDLMIRTACQQKKELAEQYQCPESEFDFTIAVAVWGKKRCGFFQVGDGAITVREGTECCYSMFPPDKGEFDNETRFLRPEAEINRDYHARLVASDDINSIAITSDGPEFLMFELAGMIPGPIFNRMFDDCAAGSLTRQDLLNYLTRGCWSQDPRGNDDRSLAILSKEIGGGDCE